MKAYRIIHTAANIAAFGLLGGFLVFFLLSYDGLGQRIGVHFSPIDGEFDVYADKLFGFYPFAAGFALLGIFSLFTIAVKKIKKLGSGVDETGERMLRCAAVLMLDIMKLMWAGFFSYWTVCVAEQHRMGDGSLLDAFRVFFLLFPLAALIVFIKISQKHRKERETVTAAEKYVMPKAHRIGHIAVNIISFASLGVFLIYFLLSFAGLPERIGVHFDGNGGFDVYSYKIFGAYPFAAGFGLLLIFSLIDLAASKVKKTGLSTDERGKMLIRCIITEYLDMNKLIWSIFFSVWAYCVINQTPMNKSVSHLLTVLFLALLPVTAAAIFVIAKKHKAKENPADEEQEETDYEESADLSRDLSQDLPKDLSQDTSAPVPENPKIRSYTEDGIPIIGVRVGTGKPDLIMAKRKEKREKTEDE